MRKLMLVPLLFLLSACEDVALARDGAALAREVMARAQPARVWCSKIRANAIGDTLRCVAYNAKGTQLSINNTAVSLWSVSDTNVLRITLDGHAWAVGRGEADIIAEDGRGHAARFCIPVMKDPGCLAGPTTPQPPPPAVQYRIAITAGDKQTATFGTLLPVALGVKVTDANGNPLNGINITWAVTGGGALSRTVTPTGTSGGATVRWTLGTTGLQSVVASVPGSAVTFTATAK